MNGCLLNTRIGILHGTDVVKMVPSLDCTRRYVGMCVVSFLGPFLFHIAYPMSFVLKFLQCLSVV